MKKVIILLVIILLIVGGVYSISQQMKQKQQKITEKTPEIEFGKQRPEAKGVIASAIPKEFILSNSVVLDSYTIPYEARLQSTVMLETTDTVKNVFGIYKESLKSRYAVETEKYTDQVANFYAFDKLARKEVNITIIKNLETKKTNVIISYLDKELKK